VKVKLNLADADTLSAFSVLGNTQLKKAVTELEVLLCSYVIRCVSVVSEASIRIENTDLE
jgi:hypothetical protein